jgi:hypothetical protein
MSDPLHYALPLSLHAEYFPMGQSIHIAANSRLIHATAESIWSRFRPMSNKSEVSLQVEIDSGHSRESVGAPILRAREHLVSMVADSRNFVNADLRAGFAFGHFTHDLVADADYWRYYFLEPLVYLLVGACSFTYLHASCISRNGRAIVLCGDSGAGKTCLAFACGLRGWTFHSGDATAILRSDVRRIVGRPFEIRFRGNARDLFKELRDFPPALRPNNKYDIEIDPVHAGLKTAPEALASHIVFLNRNPVSAKASITPFPRDEARRRLEQDICFGDETIRKAQRTALVAFLSLPVWQLNYSDWDEAEQSLHALGAGN